MKVSFHDLRMEPRDMLWSSEEEFLSESLNDTYDESIDVQIIDLDKQGSNSWLQTTSIMPSSDDNNDWRVLYIDCSSRSRCFKAPVPNKRRKNYRRLHILQISAWYS